MFADIIKINAPSSILLIIVSSLSTELKLQYIYYIIIYKYISTYIYNMRV